MADEAATFWKRCSSCKKAIGFSEKYYVCSVSTCNHKRKGFRFCSVPCWDEHLGMMNHRDAWAEERTAPSRSQYEQEEGNESPQRAPVRKVVSTPPSVSVPSSHSKSKTEIKTDTLVVVSKIKQLIKDQSGYNTSQCAVDALTKKVVGECLKAIEKAEQAGRKTVMGRDIR